MDKQSADILRRAKALIDRPEKWCQLTYGVRGVITCAEGALFFTLGDIKDMTACHIFQKAIGGFHIPGWNDAPGRTHADVMAAFDRAIALAEADVITVFDLGIAIVKEHVSDEAFISEATSSAKQEDEELIT